MAKEIMGGVHVTAGGFNCPARVHHHVQCMLSCGHLQGPVGDRGCTCSFYRPPTNSYGTSGHVKLYPGMWYDLNLTKYDISAQLMGHK